MRIMFTLTGLLVLAGLLLAAGNAGVEGMAKAGSTVSTAVRNAATEPASGSASKAPAGAAESPMGKPAEQVGGRGSQLFPSSDGIGMLPRTPGLPDIGSWITRGNRPAASAPAENEISRQRTAAELKEQLNRVDYRSKPAGVFDYRTDADDRLIYVMAKGVATVPKNIGSRGRRMALDRSYLMAKAAIARWPESVLMHKEQQDGQIAIRVVGQNESTQEQAEGLDMYRSSTVETAQSLLRGLVTVHQETLPCGDGQEAITIVGVSFKSLSAAMSMIGRLESASPPPSSPTPGAPGGPVQQEPGQVWQTSREDMEDMGF